VLLAYVDESGDTGDPANGGSLTYSLGCVLVDADLWPGALDELVAFRRRLKSTFGVPGRTEIKASYLLRNGGDLRRLGLGPGARKLIYRSHLRLLDQLPARAFAVVVDKRTGHGSPFDLAWEALLQRLERTSHHEKVTFMLIHDEGEDERIRKWVRQSRRYLTAGSAFGTGSIRNSAARLIEDPIVRRSHQSYFVQLADLVAYAAFRAVIAPGAGIAAVCPSEMWDEIGAATHTKVSALKPRAKPGIVLR
jgi:hypothetical protein